MIRYKSDFRRHSGATGKTGESGLIHVYSRNTQCIILTGSRNGGIRNRGLTSLTAGVYGISATR